MDYKTGAIAILVSSVGVLAFFLQRKPKETVVTHVVTQVVTKDVVQTKYIKVHDHIVTNKITYITKKDGTKEKIIENQLNTSTQEEATKKILDSSTSTQIVDKTVTKYTSDYILGLNYNTNYSIPVGFDYSKVNAMIGYRLIGPVFVTGTVSADFKTQSIGILINF